MNLTHIVIMKFLSGASEVTPPSGVATIRRRIRHGARKRRSSVRMRTRR